MILLARISVTWGRVKFLIRKLVFNEEKEIRCRPSSKNYCVQDDYRIYFLYPNVKLKVLVCPQLTLKRVLAS